MKYRCYSELKQLKTYKERYEYLKLSGEVGVSTFGMDRYLNQIFYKLKEWKQVRKQVIIRDNGCDLGVEDYEINDEIIIHHLNPITQEDIVEHRPWILDPEYLICCSLRTHNAIHYGDADQLIKLPVERHPGDTKLW